MERKTRVEEPRSFSHAVGHNKDRYDVSGFVILCLLSCGPVVGFSYETIVEEVVSPDSLH